MDKRLVRRTVAVAILLLAAASAQAQLTLLGGFPGSPSWGTGPTGALIIEDGARLYGMTPYGGEHGYGTVFKVGANTVGGVILRSFDVRVDGAEPFGSLVRDGTTLYGMTKYSSGLGGGTVFKMSTDGSGFDVLHRFQGLGDGQNPTGSLILIGSTLYGMTDKGGDPNSTIGDGTIFKINTDGTDYAVLHSFDFFDPDNGAKPGDRLTTDGLALYGVTSLGGAYQWGTVFKVNLDGSGFTVLHSFANDDPNEGTQPTGSLRRIGTTLYGMTQARGSGLPPVPPECIDTQFPPDYCYGTATARPGIIFKINTDGSGYTIVHGFETGPGGGGYPASSLAFDGDFLYGMTAGYGAPEEAPELEALPTVFRIKPDGACFRVLHSFAGAPNDALPSLIAYGAGLTIERTERDRVTLYGMTKLGGRDNLGAAFRLDNANVPFEASAGFDQTVEATSAAGAQVSLSGSAGGPADAVEYHWTAPGVVFDDPASATPSGVFPVGQTVATLTADDGTGCTDTDEVLITVQDTTPPAVSCTVSPTQLFPPSHEMVPISVAVCATDATTQPTEMSLGRATAASNEPDNGPGLGDGDTIGDTDGGNGFNAPVNIASKLSFRASTGCFEGTIGLRAERAGTKRDRIYTLRTGVKDLQNREGLGSCSVTVPHN